MSRRLAQFKFHPGSFNPVVLALVAGIFINVWGSFAAGAAELGVNDFFLARQYLGYASQGDGSDRYRRVEIAMAAKALRDAQVNGASFVRLSASGFAPSSPGQGGDLDLWRADREKYWGRIDEMMAALDKYGLRGVFSFVWNPLQFPAMTGETVRDMVTNPNSKSYGLAAKYVEEFVSRYRGRHTVLFYELTNEFNLGADLDLAGGCQKSRGVTACASQGNYTTDEMIRFCQRLATVIRNADSGVKISSGFSLPRKAAEHLRSRPEWVTGSADFTPDSLDQFEKNLRDIHAMVDIIGVHIYADPDGENMRFGVTDARSTKTFEITVLTARKIGKPIYVGEFGDADRGDSDDSSFTIRMFDKIAELRPAYSSPWVWEFYQSNTYRTHDTRASQFSMEPGITDRQISKFRQLAMILGEPVPAQKALEKVSPHVVLTWPLDCTLLADPQLVHAVASDDAGRSITVKILLDDKQMALKGVAPFEAQIPIAGVAPGNHILEAIAVDSAGLRATYETPVIIGAVTSGGACTRAFPSR